MKGKIENFLRRLYNDLNEDYRAEKEELEKIKSSIQAFESGGELSAMDQASYIAAQSMEIGCSAYCKRIENALNSIKLLIQPGASVPAIAENLLIQYYAACKNAAKNEGRTDMDNVLSVQISRIESQLREVGYAIFGGPSTIKKIEKEKAEGKLKKAEAKLKKAQRRLNKADPAAAENHADETNCADPTAQTGDTTADAKEDPADPAAAENHADETNCADPTAQTGDTPADAKEDPADPAAAENHADETNCADPTAQTGDTPADSEEEPEEDTIQLVIRLIVIG